MGFQPVSDRLRVGTHRSTGKGEAGRLGSAGALPYVKFSICDQKGRARAAALGREGITKTKLLATESTKRLDGEFSERKNDVPQPKRVVLRVD
jgi:hypothetical protein